jgi:hypothetical protein
MNSLKTQKCSKKEIVHKILKLHQKVYIEKFRVDNLPQKSRFYTEMGKNNIL